MTSLKDFRATMHKLIAADDIDEANASVGYDPKAVDLFKQSNSYRAVRSVNKPVAKK